jgi:hypothetical protein
MTDVLANVLLYVLLATLALLAVDVLAGTELLHRPTETIPAASFLVYLATVINE